MKTMKLVAIASAMALSSWAVPASAANITADPALIAAALQKAGYQAKVEKEEDGTPYILSSSGGYDFVVFLLGCTKGQNCTTVQFYAGFKNTGFSVENANAWNSDNRFGRAYISDKGSARLEMDVDLDHGGMSPALFEDNFELWVAVMGKFAKFIRK